ncbi:MAG: putative protein YibN [Legionellaceae bacterium]
METFIHFLLNHWILSSAFIIVTLLLLVIEMMNNLTGIAQISPQEATHLINHQNANILDIRPTERFMQGHIIGSINIPSSHIDQQYDKLKAEINKPLIIVCDSGQNSRNIASLLKKQGFSSIVALKNGLNAWKENQLPLVKK